MKDGKSDRGIHERPEEWLFCQTLEEWRAWLSRHHEEEEPRWLRLRKVKSKGPGILLDEAVIEALRFGWIDGHMHSLGEEGILVRFTRRRRGSNWSARNRRRAEALIREGRMLEPGMAAIRQAMDNGRWDAAYEEMEKGEDPGMKTVRLGSGTVLHYLEKGDREGAALILLPGIADSCHTFDLLLPHLPEDLRVLAVSPRGHGDSDAPPSGYRTEDFTLDLKQFMEATGVEKAVIAGASSGGFVARRFAITCPERTRGIILLGVPAMLSDKPVVQKAWKETISRLEDPVDPDFVRGFPKEETVERVPESFREMMVEENLKVPARVWVQTTEGLLEETFPDGLSMIGSPVLILWGDKDTVSPRAEQEGVAKEIPDAELVVLEGLGHMLYWEDPRRVAEEISAFMQTFSS